MPVRIVTQPQEEPVDLDLAKSHLRLETELDDDYLESLLIPAARQYIERVCWRGLLLQTWELQLGGFRGPDRLDMTPDWRSSTPSFVGPMSLANWTRGDVRGRFEPYLELPRGHLASSPNVTITYLDANGASQPLASSVYRAEGAGNDEMEGRIWLARGQQWPATDSQFDAVKVQYQVGWDSADQVPAPIRQAILVVLAQMYEHRTPEIDGRLSEAEFTSTRLCSPYRLLKV
jgi:hypothetical protein